jgi:hypothetical protein
MYLFAALIVSATAGWVGFVGWGTGCSVEVAADPMEVI